MDRLPGLAAALGLLALEEVGLASVGSEPAYVLPSFRPSFCWLNSRPDEVATRLLLAELFGTDVGGAA